MDLGRGETIVTTANINCSPLFFSAGVVYVGETVTIIECRTTNTSHAIGDCYAC